MPPRLQSPSLFLLVAGALLPLSIALLLLFLVILPAPDDPFEMELEQVHATDSPTLESLFADFGYFWPPVKAIPRIWVHRIPPDAERLPVKRKKALFFRALTPLVLAENERVLRQRDFIQRTYAGGSLRPGSAKYWQLLQLAREYGVEAELSSGKAKEELLRRVDTLPLGLVLAQAANESAWGTSRFTREGNNLFGEWTWKREAGIIPRERAAASRHYVRSFPHLRQSVRSYLNNLNSGRAYAKLRRLRAALRAGNRPMDPLVLAGALSRYSERRGAYVAELRSIIRHNGLNRLGRLRLAAPATSG